MITDIRMARTQRLREQGMVLLLVPVLLLVLVLLLVPVLLLVLVRAEAAGLNLAEWVRIRVVAQTPEVLALAAF